MPTMTGVNNIFYDVHSASVLFATGASVRIDLDDLSDGKPFTYACGGAPMSTTPHTAGECDVNPLTGDYTVTVSFPG